MNNSFGNLFRITTWGESHGTSVGVIIDGCPSGLVIDLEHINAALARRAPGGNAFVSPRKETDVARIESGIFEGRTTGTPICLKIDNHDADSSKYDVVKDIYRPSHANYTYLKKYGIYDHRGGGRASARETACRVAAGAVADALLQRYGIQVQGYLASVENITCSIPANFEELQTKVQQSEIFIPDPVAEEKICQLILEMAKVGDSVGGIVGFQIQGMPMGIGEPLYNKLHAMLGFAMLSISACKGFEYGEGFASTRLHGSEHNDPFVVKDGKVTTSTNHAGGILAGISTGQDIYGRVAFKPTASILQPQSSVDLNGNPVEFALPKGSRHDPCVAIRAVPVVEAMCKLVIADALLMQNSRGMTP